MKNLFIKTSILLVFVGLFTACEPGEFGDMNTDPNNPTKATTAYLLTGAISNSIDAIITSPDRSLYIQYFSETQYPGSSIYDGFSRWSYNALYRDLFRLKMIKDYNEGGELKKKASSYGHNDAQIAISEIYSCYIFQMVTNLLGPIPYSQALGGGKYNFKPKFDSQESVYKDIFKRLASAISLIEKLPSGAKTVKGDIVFKGDVNKWKRFAHMLRASMAMRISDVDATLAKAEFLKSKDGLITSNAESLGFKYLAETAWENPWYSRFRSREDYAISSTLVNFLKDRKDKRLFQFAEKTDDLKTKPDFQAYNGLTYGLSGSDVGSIAKSSYSYPHKTGVRQQDKTIYYYTYAQASFLKAEAAQKGWITGSAETFYKDAIKASMEQWGVKDESGYYNTYLGHAKVKWDASKAKQLIGEQKWIALFLQGEEAYASWRRLDFPVLKPAPGAVNRSKKTPLRHTYATSVENLNASGYASALKLLGGKAKDDDQTRVWWDTK